MRQSETSGTATCPVAEDCGGCAWIGRDYSAQLRAKTERVRRAFDRRPTLAEVAIEPCLAAPERVAYRNRAKLAVREHAGDVRIGLFRRGTNAIVDLAPCRVQRPALQRGIGILRDWLRHHGLARSRGPVFYVDLREAAGERCHLTLVLDRPDAAEGLPLDALLEAWPALCGVAINVGDPQSSFPLGPHTRTLRGAAEFPATLPRGDGGLLELSVPAGGFFQVGTSVLGEVHDEMAAHLLPAVELLDLYCGVGVHGIAIALRSRGPVALTGIEESESLIDAARRNARRHGLAARYEAGRVELRAEDLLRSAGTAVLNPGRAGCGARVAEALAAGERARLAYLSCNPDSLARDLAVLLAGGLRLERVVPVDLMPQTDHVETLALLDRRPAAPARDCGSR